jgi:hypothetical protein
MKPIVKSRVVSAQNGRKARVSIVTLILLLLALVLGAATGAFWFSRGAGRISKKVEGEKQGQPTLELTDTTKAILKRINSPIEIRFYSLLDPTTVDDATRTFANRTEQMLAAYQQEAQGRITVAKSNSQSYSTANAARADGIKPFNTDRGEPCFLGLAVVGKGQKESLPNLSPEWETVLEADISRAILRVAETQTPEGRTASKPEIDGALVEEVKRSLTNADSISLEEGTRILREAALKQFSATALEVQKELQQAQQELTHAQSSGSEAEQLAAMKHLQQVQARQTEQLKKIAADSQAQIEALRQLKAGKQ